MIKTNKLTKSYNKRIILDDVSINLDGGIYGLLGKNGAGKTTLLKAILGLISIESGNINILGEGSIKDEIKLLRNIGSTIETPKHYQHLSAKENLSIHLSYLNYSHKEQDKLIKETLKLVGLEDATNEIVSNFSLGMKQRLAIARAIIHQPKILILDEPLNGLDPFGIKKMRELLIKLSNENNVLILFSSHILQEVLLVSDYILVLHDGKIAFNKRVNELDTTNFENCLMKIMEE